MISDYKTPAEKRRIKNTIRKLYFEGKKSIEELRVKYEYKNKKSIWNILHPEIHNTKQREARLKKKLSPDLSLR